MTATRRHFASRALLALLLGLLASLLIGEIALRIHNPVDVRIKESEIRLPVNKNLVYRNPGSAKLDDEIRVTRNVLGFRGPDPPKDFAERLTIVTVGGSTTECRYLTDGKTWPDRLAARLAEKHEHVWLNNAGMDGQSTFGSIILLKQVLLDLHPDVLVFLVGVNDAGRSDLNRSDAHAIGERTPLGRVIDASELLSTLRVITRAQKARERQLDHVFDLDLAKIPMKSIPPEEAAARLERARREKAVAGFRKRLNELVLIARGAGIEPILITQPTLFGEGIDPTTGIDLGPLEYGVITSGLMGEVLDVYNDVTRSVGRSHELLVIDLARELPRDSAYYYDWIHFTNEGAERVGEILSREMEEYLAGRGAVLKDAPART